MLNSERIPWDRDEREGYPFEDMEKLDLPLQTLKNRTCLNLYCTAIGPKARKLPENKGEEVSRGIPGRLFGHPVYGLHCLGAVKELLEPIVKFLILAPRNEAPNVEAVAAETRQ